MADDTNAVLPAYGHFQSCYIHSGHYRDRKMRLFTALLCASLAGACRSSTAPQPPADPLALPGTYDLATVNGAVLPYTIQPLGQPGSGLPKEEILSNRMIVSPTGQFTLTIVKRISSIPGDGTLSQSDGGTYTVDSTAKQASFTFNSDHNAYPVALASAEFTISVGQFAERFVKQ